MEQSLDQLIEDFKMLTNKTRINIITLLLTGELCVCDIVEKLGISQPLASQQLRKLKIANFVTESKRGQWVYYALNLEKKPHIQSLLPYIPKAEVNQTSDCCNESNELAVK